MTKPAQIFAFALILISLAITAQPSSAAISILTDNAYTVERLMASCRAEVNKKPKPVSPASRADEQTIRFLKDLRQELDSSLSYGRLAETARSSAIEASSGLSGPAVSAVEEAVKKALFEQRKRDMVFISKIDARLRLFETPPRPGTGPEQFANLGRETCSGFIREAIDEDLKLQKRKGIALKTCLPGSVTNVTIAQQFLDEYSALYTRYNDQAGIFSAGAMRALYPCN